MVNNIFWHICLINQWKKVVVDQYQTLLDSKILDKVENVYISSLGKNEAELDFLLQMHPKLKLKQHTTDIRLYESFTLNDLHQWAQSNDSNVLYIHSKGVSYNNWMFGHIWNWRKLMEYFLIEQHENCIDLLDNQNKDAIGCLLINSGKKIRILDEKHNYHFSGNFWWTTTKYIKTLPRLPNVDMRHNWNYWMCERWILYHYPNLNIHVAYDSKNKHYYNFSPDPKYRIKV